MSLVSSLYRLVPSETYHFTEEEREQRLRLAIRRLLARLPADKIVAAIRASSEGTEVMRAWLILTVYAEEKRQRRP